MGRPAIINPLAMGFYSVPEAARLIEVGSARRIYGWLRGYANRASGPLIERQFEPLDGKEEISFLDLMELRLIETLRDQEVRPRTIRSAIIEARKIFENERPFATDRILLKTDGKHVFVEEVLKKVAQEEKDKRLWNLITKQYEHYELMERTSIKGVTFDPEKFILLEHGLPGQIGSHELLLILELHMERLLLRIMCRQRRSMRYSRRKMTA